MTTHSAYFRVAREASPEHLEALRRVALRSPATHTLLCHIEFLVEQIRVRDLARTAYLAGESATWPEPRHALLGGNAG